MTGSFFDVPDCELGHHGEDVSFNSILKNTSSPSRRCFCSARLYAQLIRIPPIRIQLEKACAGSPAASAHSD